MSRAESGAAGHILGPRARQAWAAAASARVCQKSAPGKVRQASCQPPIGRLPLSWSLAQLTSEIPITVVSDSSYRSPFPSRSKSGAGLRIAGLPGIRIRASIRGQVAAADSNPLDPLGAPPLLPRKHKNAVDADPGNAGFSLGQPALLGGDKAAENAALSVIDGYRPVRCGLSRPPRFRLW